MTTLRKPGRQSKSPVKKIITPRHEVFGDVAHNQYRLLVRAEKTDDDRLLKIQIGLGFLAGVIRANEPREIRSVLQRLAAHATGWVEHLGITEDVFALIHAERDRQERLFVVEKKFLFTCASRTASPVRKLRVLVEEVGEVAEAIDKIEVCEAAPAICRRHLPHLRKYFQDELIQVAAVCVAWLESLEQQRNEVTKEGK